MHLRTGQAGKDGRLADWHGMARKTRAYEGATVVDSLGGVIQVGYLTFVAYHKGHFAASGGRLLLPFIPIYFRRYVGPGDAP